jgi:tetratricopeptide (TPR) repeat protein
MGRPLVMGLVALCVLVADAGAQVAAGDAAWNQGRYAEARDAYLRALAQDPASVRANYRLAVLASWNDELDSALALLHRARASDPADPDLRAAEAQILGWAGRYEESLVRWDSLIALYPDRREGLVGKARTLSWHDRLREADSVYSLVLDRDPTDPDGLNGRAQVAFWQGELRTAIAGYERTLSYHPGNVDAMVGLGQVYHAQGRDFAALAQADRAVTAAPSHREARLLREDALRGSRPVVEVGVTWTDDSDHNTSWWESIGASTLLVDGLRGFASIHALQATDPTRDAGRGGGELGITYGQGTWQITVAAGAQALWPDSGLTRTTPTARLGAVYRVLPAIGVGASYAHFPFAETAFLIGADLDVDAVDGTLDATLAPGLSLGAGGGTAWFSDGNQRASAVVALTRELPQHFFVGAVGRMVWFDEPGTGYFSPDQFTTAEIRAGYARPGRIWETRLSGGLGGQQIGTTGEWQVAWHAEGRAAKRFASRHQIELFAGISTSALSSTTGAYRWGTVGAVVRLGL